MPRTTLPLLAGALSLAMAACSPGTGDAADPAQPAGIPPTEPAAAPTTAMTPATSAPAAEDRCDASAAQSLVGQQATEDVVEQARSDAGADSARTLHPDQAVTMEYLEGRLNIDVDENGVITGLRCG